MLPRAQRLTVAEFEHAFNRSRSTRGALLNVRVHRRDDGREIVRAAFAVPKKLGRAAWRNKVRRRVREAYRQCKYLQDEKCKLRGCDLIFFASAKAAEAPLQVLADEIEQLLRRAAR